MITTFYKILIAIGLIISGLITLGVLGIFDSKKKENYSSKNPQKNIDFFYDQANSVYPVTDKIIIHEYHRMYGSFLIPFYKSKPNMKFLEIGLGCGMSYGPGTSYYLWKKLFPKADIWLADNDQNCVENWKKAGKLTDVNILIGDQENEEDLKRWISETDGGNFDIIIDDGGHKQCQIFNSFNKLWPVLNPGGLYFIEDLQVADDEVYKDNCQLKCGIENMPTVLKEWSEQLLYKTQGDTKWKYKIPQDVAFIYIQAEACVIGKRAK